MPFGFFLFFFFVFFFFLFFSFSFFFFFLFSFFVLDLFSYNVISYNVISYNVISYNILINYDVIKVNLYIACMFSQPSGIDLDGFLIGLKRLSKRMEFLDILYGESLFWHRGFKHRLFVWFDRA